MTDEERLEAIQRDLAAFGERLQAWVDENAPVLDLLLSTMSSIIANAYRRAGQPYGDNQESLMRWLREASEAARLRAESERIKDYHRGLAAFRQRLQEHYPPQP